MLRYSGGSLKKNTISRNMNELVGRARIQFEVDDGCCLWGRAPSAEFLQRRASILTTGYPASFLLPRDVKTSRGTDYVRHVKVIILLPVSSDGRMSVDGAESGIRENPSDRHKSTRSEVVHGRRSTFCCCDGYKTPATEAKEEEPVNHCIGTPLIQTE